MSSGESTGEIIKSLVVNIAIAVGKGIAAAITGSGAMLAETLHSAADCSNQILLLRGVKASRRPPDASHPLGYGRLLYFYSFIVALLLFFGGGVFSINEGIEKVLHPEPVGDITMAMIILLGSLLLEGWSLYGNIVVLNKQRKGKSFIRALRDTKDSDLIVVFGENSAAVLGLVFAMVAVGLAKLTGEGYWDGIGSLGIGLVLIGVATFLAREVRSLIVGESADESIKVMLDTLAAEDPNVDAVLNVITLQQGPGEIVVAMKIKMRAGLSGDQVVDAINTFEKEAKVREPAIKWSFIEPDHVA